MIRRSFTIERETKNTIRYMECVTRDVAVGPDIAVGYIYIRKSVLNPNPPKKITVTIEEET